MGDYKTYLLSLTVQQWPEQFDFWNEHSIAGKPVKLIYKEAYKKGRVDGQNKVIRLLIHQILIFACVKTLTYLTEDICKRKAAQRTLEHIPSFCMADTDHEIGMEIMDSLTESYEKQGNVHHWKDIDWDAVVAIVGIENVAKKVSDELFYYSDLTTFTWNENNQSFAMYFIPVRWDVDNHRHRNIPLLFE